jgi:hypothetical protein
MSQINVDRIVDTSGGVLAPISSVMRNRIINGAMVIDQRNAGASITANNGVYAVDRFRTYMSQSSKGNIQQNAGSVTPPAGFSNYLGFTSTSAYAVLSGDYFVISQYVEGFNTADLNFGTANAKTVTLSFWVQSSLTGTFGGSLENSAFNRSYPFTYSIPTASTWTQISVTIAGDTTGTWVGATNGIGIRVNFSLGVGTTYSGTAGAWAGSDFQSATGATSVVGTSGATFYITGVQLEVGSQATSFEYRQYGQELALCQRYFFKTFAQGTAVAQNVGVLGAIPSWSGGGSLNSIVNLPVTMRATPTIVAFNPSAANSNYTTGETSTVSASSISDRQLYIFSSAPVGTFGNIHGTASAEL